MPEHLSKAQDIPLAPGDRVRVRTPGGGGYGDPRDRDAVARATSGAAATRPKKLAAVPCDASPPTERGPRRDGSRYG